MAKINKRNVSLKMNDANLNFNFGKGADVEISDRVNQGYVIKDSIHVGNTEFVLGELFSQTLQKTMYVTWQCKNSIDYFFGHYFDNDILAAKKDLVERASKEIEYLMDIEREKNTPKEIDYGMFKVDDLDFKAGELRIELSVYDKNAELYLDKFSDKGDNRRILVYGGYDKDASGNSALNIQLCCAVDFNEDDVTRMYYQENLTNKDIKVLSVLANEFCLENENMSLKEFYIENKKHEIATTIGDWYGTYKEPLTIDNGEQKFKYHKVDDLLCDWFETLLEDHKDTGDSWLSEMDFIFDNCKSKYMPQSAKQEYVSIKENIAKENAKDEALALIDEMLKDAGTRKSDSSNVSKINDSMEFDI